MSKRLQPLRPSNTDSVSALKQVPFSVFRDLCTLANSAVSKQALNHLKQKDFVSLVSMTIDPASYDDPEAFALDYQVISFFKKYTGFNTGIDKKGKAFGKWLSAEALCSQTNAIFRKHWDGTFQFRFPVEEVLHLTKRKINVVLGDFRDADIEHLRDAVRHGPGSDLDLRKSNASSYEKFRTWGSITPSCRLLYHDYFSSDNREDLSDRAGSVGSGKLTFVPKNALIDRIVMTEPRWNVFIQLGFGSILSGRLHRLGVNIRDQSRNQYLASTAHVDGLATIDLSSASDTIATNLVIDLLSECDDAWLDFILKSRTPSVFHDGKNIRLEKISSMGNGYTFPLQTLIFTSICKSVCEFLKLDPHNALSYGDDIIVPQKAVPLLTEVLSAFGFIINRDKSFASGNFFESCGADFFMGRNVRPIFQKEDICGIPDLFTLHNQLVLRARQGMLPYTADSRYWKVSMDRVVRHLPLGSRLFGPIGQGGVLHAPYDLYCHLLESESDQWEAAYSIKSLVATRQKLRRGSYYGHLWSKLTQDVNCGNCVLDASSDTGYVVKKVRCLVQDFVLI